MTVGVWHHYEALLEVNSAPGLADGKLSWWIDGVQVIDRSDMIYTTPSYPRMFYNWYYYPDWGGNGGCPTSPCLKHRDDYFLIDHVYVGGIPK